MHVFLRLSLLLLLYIVRNDENKDDQSGVRGVDPGVSGRVTCPVFVIVIIIATL